MHPRLLWFLFGLYLLLVAKLILFKKQLGTVFYHYNDHPLSFRQNLRRANLFPLKSIAVILEEQPSSFIIQNIFGNIIMFIPLGIFLPVIWPSLSSFKKVLAGGFLVSLAFELIQLVAVLGIFDVDDILLNTIGAAIGYVIYKSFFGFKKGLN